MEPHTLRVIYIQPTTYDDDGYPLKYMRGILPSNTLMVLKGLAEAAGQSGALGPGVDVKVRCYDDTVQKIPFRKIARWSRRKSEQVLVGITGVQSNHMPRAMDIARKLRDSGVQVMMGGFHVSGVLALQGKPTPELQELLDAGVTLVRGEVEGDERLPGILKDALAGELKPLYDFPEPPDIRQAAAPLVDPDYMKHFVSHSMATIDTSRGCPFGCSFCTVINVQGRRMRSRSAECVLRAVRENYRRGVRTYFFTDDNLARSAVWEEVFDGLIAMREVGMKVSFMMQVDTQARRLPHFVEKAAAAGCYMVFIGMESVNPKNMEATGKRQNDTSKYADMVQAWRDASILVHVGYIIGLPHDTPESVTADIETLAHGVRVDKVSFFMLTPLPGSKDHLDMVRDGVEIDPDLNRYDSIHETFKHPGFDAGGWQQTYRDAWLRFYSVENIVDILLRGPREQYWPLFWFSMWYRYAALAGEHPMFTGLGRLKGRRDRRAGMPRENVFRYLWRRTSDWYQLARTYGRMFFELQEIWMLTREPEDPRWATLAELRARWERVQTTLAQADMRDSYDALAYHLRDILSSASIELRELSGRRRLVSRRVSHRLRELAHEAETRLRRLDVRVPSAEELESIRRFAAERVVKGYEELAIGHVRRRRKFNKLRRDLVTALKRGTFWRLNWLQMPKALVFEVFVGFRFTVAFMRRARKRVRLESRSGEAS